MPHEDTFVVNSDDFSVNCGSIFVFERDEFEKEPLKDEIIKVEDDGGLVKMSSILIDKMKCHLIDLSDWSR